MANKKACLTKQASKLITAFMSNIQVYVSDLRQRDNGLPT